MSSRPVGTDEQWFNTWYVKVLVWALPVVFMGGTSYAAIQVLDRDVKRIESVQAERRLIVLEERVKALEELRALTSQTNSNVQRLCRAQGVSCD